jgi:hypothetical protein
VYPYPGFIAFLSARRGSGIAAVEGAGVLVERRRLDRGADAPEPEVGVGGGAGSGGARPMNTLRREDLEHRFPGLLPAYLHAEAPGAPAPAARANGVEG